MKNRSVIRIHRIEKVKMKYIPEILVVRHCGRYGRDDNGSRVVQIYTALTNETEAKKLHAERLLHHVH